MTHVSERKERPVLSGLLALLGVGVAVGLILGVGALVVARVAGIGGGSASSGASAAQSMYIPPLEETEKASPGPFVSDGGPRGSQSPSSAATAITLTAGQAGVAPMQQIDLTGSYPGGDGAILRVQRFQGGSWGDFPVTTTVSGGTFSTYVQTGQTGMVRFRVVDTDSQEASNEVKVRVG
jgi:hypothetical protein